MNVLFTIRTITGLHVGCGQAPGPIDLPIAREASTQWPVVPGTSVKGVLRDATRESLNGRAEAIFGSEGENGRAGSLCTTDLACLLFPIASWAGCFAWVTCPIALRRFEDALRRSGEVDDAEHIKKVRDQFDFESCLVNSSNQITVRGSVLRVVLSEIDLAPSSADLSKMASVLSSASAIDSKELELRLVVVSDTVFTLLTKLGTQKSTKVTLEQELKRAKTGGLRTEESVPPDAVFWGEFVFQRVGSADPADNKRALLDSLEGKLLQFGGKSTTGQGLCEFNVASQ